MNEKDLEKWREDVKHEIERWRADPDYVPILPIPASASVLELSDG